MLEHSVKYDAFMSYSHSADGGLVPAVQKALHRFAKPWYRLRMLHIFRDQTSLAVTPKLWGSIENALSQSKHFLLGASPEAAASHWVRDEIEWWLRNGDSHRMFILLTAGDILWAPKIDDFDWKTTTALPRTLSGSFTAEPLFVDLRFARDPDDLLLRNAPFRETILDLAAPLHDRPKEELGGQDVREHRRALRIAVAAVVTLVILLIGAVTAAWIATVQRDLSRSRELVALARKHLGSDPAISLALATNAMEIQPTLQLAFSPEGRYLIAAGDNGFTERDQVEDKQIANLPGTVFALGTDMVATAGNDHIVRLWEMSGSVKAELGRHAAS